MVYNWKIFLTLYGSEPLHSRPTELNKTEIQEQVLVAAPHAELMD
jgi:hypothetical protein